ncbi:alpha-glucan family phosphorylase [uncultured Paludibaculum sp.]|uniref:alpha-glucan family phosphorylase n=1 Tax=uncultured Paludibaculum sp. TaxID=1765020 RepID=UPI002AAA7495|nr:alpha-glucan family phosphorylase [uncultured Paludibaculum sp.]
MPRVYSFHVSPKLPERLRCLNELSLNLRWSWHHPTIELFRSIDPDLWEETGHNPRWMLGRVNQKRLAELELDEAFLAQMDRAASDLEDYLGSVGRFSLEHPQDLSLVVAYFSAEFGLTECIPNYAGGLGILAGDHLKSASDLGLPLVGVGLLYQGGYFHQYLNADGWQQETYPINDFHRLPIAPVVDAAGAPVFISVEFPARSVYARIWKIQVGRIPLYLLDTNVKQNRPDDCKVTGALYGGDRELRMQQEIILGIGGMRALKALGIHPTVCHMNEGHSAFLGLERSRMTMEEFNLPYYQARQLSAAGSVFTTHTPVPAGFDRFETWLMEKYFREYTGTLGLTFERLLEYGRQDPTRTDEQFNMAFLAARHSAYCNGVSRLHGEVSRRMAQAMWSGYSLQEVPIGYVTNGIHTRSWVSMEMSALLNRYLGPRWAEEPPGKAVWDRIERIPDGELWRVHQIRRERLIHYSRTRLSDQLRRRGATESEVAAGSGVLTQGVLTIGFARRFATYKRATLLLRDPARLKRILNNAERPVQILVAGKAHPHDNEGKELIRRIIHFARDPEVRRSMVFLEDYDISVARYLVQGVDVWLNTPQRPNEASGTSGMKLLANGGLNLSILDGWWDEAYCPEVGWAIGHGENYTDADAQDQIEADALYNLLEHEVVPLFYQRDSADLPRGWIKRMKASMCRLSPVFCTNRMVAEYAERFYVPAHRRHQRLAADGAARVRPLVDWRRRVLEFGRQVRITNVDSNVLRETEVGSEVKVSVRVQLASLTPDDVRVQIYHGPVNADGGIPAGEAVDMDHQGLIGGEHLYTGRFICNDSGSSGFSVRVTPYHEDAIVPYEMPWVQWAE